jgi:hypothetical protein
VESEFKEHKDLIKVLTEERPVS